MARQPVAITVVPAGRCRAANCERLQPVRLVVLERLGSTASDRLVGVVYCVWLTGGDAMLSRSNTMNDVSITTIASMAIFIFDFDKFIAELGEKTTPL